MLCQICLFFILSDYYSLDACFLSNERRKGVDLDGQRDGEELGRVRGEKIILPESIVC